MIESLMAPFANEALWIILSCDFIGGFLIILFLLIDKTGGCYISGLTKLGLLILALGLFFSTPFTLNALTTYNLLTFNVWQFPIWGLKDIGAAFVAFGVILDIRRHKIQVEKLLKELRFLKERHGYIDE